LESFFLIALGIGVVDELGIKQQCKKRSPSGEKLKRVNGVFLKYSAVLFCL